jgi:hypothetical protein
VGTSHFRHASDVVTGEAESFIRRAQAAGRGLLEVGGSQLQKLGLRPSAAETPQTPVPEPKLLDVTPAQQRGYELAFEMLQVYAGDVSADDAAPEISRGSDGVLELKLTSAKPERLSA